MKRFRKISIALSAVFVITAVLGKNTSSVSVKADAVSITAALKGEAGEYAYWGENDDGNTGKVTRYSAEITGNGTYTASWELAGSPAVYINFLMLEISSDQTSFTTDVFPDLAVSIESIEIDGTRQEYSPSANAVDLAYYKDKNTPGTVRIYMTDCWGVSTGETIQDLPGNTVVNRSIAVTFSISYLGSDGILYGDVNQNGKIDTMDAYAVLKEIALKGASLEGELSDEQILRADVTNDGSISTMDAYYILFRTAQIGAKEALTPFPVENTL